VSALIAALASLLGFALLALSYDRIVDRTEPPFGIRLSTHAGQLAGASCLLLVGVLSIYEYGLAFGVMAWAGWLAVGALSGVAVLAVVAAIRGPLPVSARRRKIRPNAPDSRDMLPR